MNCITEKNIVSASPALAGTLRFFLGLTVMVFGLFLGLFYEWQGQGLGFILLLASPFIVLTDQKKSV